MRSSLFRKLMFCGVVALAALGPREVVAQQTLTFGLWTRFEWFDGVGAVDGAGFSFESLLQTRLRVTDAYFTGDAFDILVNGTPFTRTESTVFGGGAATIASGEAAWADPSLGKVDVVLAPGRYTITLAVREDAGFGQGEGFLRADALAPTSTVPEPGSVVLLATGLAGALVIARRRARG